MKRCFVNSLPKSGTNLLAKCLLLFGYTERGHISAGTILDQTINAKFKNILWSTGSTGYSIGINTPMEVRKLPINIKLNLLKNNEFISGHVGYNDILLNSIIKKGIVPIQVIRDPRAVLASFVPYVLQDKKHFLYKTFISMADKERYKAALSGISVNSLILQPMKNYCQALSPWINNRNVYCIKYEDIVGNQGGGSDTKRYDTLAQLAEILALPKEHIDNVANKLYGPGRHTFRKGNINSWKEEIPVEVLDHMSNELEEILMLWGYQGR